MAQPDCLDILLQRYRTARGISEVELAKRIGVSRQTLVNWRIGPLRAMPATAHLRAAARELGAPYREVLEAALRDSGYLTDADLTEPRPYAAVHADAARALTEAARLTTQVMREDTAGGWEPEPNTAPQRIDWASFVADALASAAANIGSIESIMSTSTGPQAAGIAELLNRTVGAPQNLPNYRTEPVQLTIWMESILADRGDPTIEQYHAARAELDARAAAVDPSDTAAIAAVATLREKLEKQYFAELMSYSDRLVKAIVARVPLPRAAAPSFIKVVFAPEGADLADGRPPAPTEGYIGAGIAAAIAETPTPATLPGTALTRLTEAS